MADIKSSASQIEGLDKPKQDVEILPEVLQGRSQDDLARLGRKTTLKLDLIIMRAMTTLYITNYLDRQNVAAANLAGITEDLNLSATQYQTVISILFVGYSPIEPRRLKDQVSGHIHLSAVFIWGTISACTAAVHSFGGLLACRFFLGLVEAAFFPGAFYYISMFYNRKQIAFRTAILYSGSQLGNAFGTLLAIGIMKLDGYHGIAGWRWLFLIEGIITIGFAVIFGLYLPNHPQKIMGLNEEERAWLRWNYETDQKQQDDSSEVTAKQGLMMAVTDPKTWLLCGTLYATYTAAAVNNFFPTVVLGLGFSRNKSYGLTAPPFILCVFCMLLNGFHSDKKQERFWHIAWPLCVTVNANVIALSTLNVAARYFAMMLLPASFYSSAIVQLSWIAGSLAQPSVKRAASIALINCICNTPNIWTSYTYFGEPRYVAAFGVNLGAAVIAIGMATATFFYLRRKNLKLDQGQTLGKSGPTAIQQASGFRYVL